MSIRQTNGYYSQLIDLEIIYKFVGLEYLTEMNEQIPKSQFLRSSQETKKNNEVTVSGLWISHESKIFKSRLWR